MFAKKTRIISLLLAAVLLLCPLQAASAETQTVSEKIKANLIEQIEQNPDGKFGVCVALVVNDDEIYRQAKEIWEKETVHQEGSVSELFWKMKRDFYPKYRKEFLDAAGLTAEDRIMDLLSSYEYLILDKEQIYRIAELDQVKSLDFFASYPIKMFVIEFTCEDALHILQAAVGLRMVELGPRCDVNQDGITDVVDALLALQSAVGLRTISWPEGMAFPE